MINSQTLNNTPVKVKRKKKVDVSALIICLVALLFTIAPMYVMLVTSIETYEETNYANFVWWPADGPTFESYIDILTLTMFISYFIGVSLPLIYFQIVTLISE